MNGRTATLIYLLRLALKLCGGSVEPPKGLPNPAMVRHESCRMSIRGPVHVSRSGYSQPSMLRFTISVHKVSSNEVLPFVQRTCREASAD